LRKYYKIIWKKLGYDFGSSSSDLEVLKEKEKINIFQFMFGDGEKVMIACALPILKNCNNQF